ncbi:MAG TPA: serine protease HtrA [Faecalibacterium sp.]|uniref:S1C family serine protease n=1 Tax=Faecalibacterium prausnitzii TaxID=853 RepID=UPI000E8FA716|nr:trypsin-like peptidase domain-containing protein [Faecalibacterium prausnitzii]HAQ97107.1 serine protease HtrA [Faecalibacterium sp.]
MANENKWEYDYSSQNNTGGTDTGYPNVGSSGMNTANQYNDPQPQYTAPNVPPMPDAGAGGVTPPVYPAQPQQAQPPKPKKKKKFNGGRVARSAVALVLAAAMGFAGGFVGAKYGGSGKVVIQQAAPSAASDSSTGSSGADSTITAASSSGSSLTTEQVADMVSPSVVVITTEQVVYSQWSWYGQSQVESGAGSGVIISSDGYILTCAHVVDGASSITVTIDDKDYTATLVGEDTTSDVAVIKIDATGLTPATVGDSDNLKVGQSVMAVGNPLGELGGTVTGGMISALNRSVTIQGTSSTNTMSLIQMDASVSPGNSGGGLFNMSGELVGIVNAKSSSSDAEGLGFAIPINDAIKVAQELLENGYVTGRPYLGITYLGVEDAQTAAQLGVNAYGVYVVEVVKGGPAERAGLQSGDRIVSIDGTEIASKDDLGTLMQKHAAGDTLNITIARNGQMQTVSVTLGEKTASNS